MERNSTNKGYMSLIVNNTQSLAEKIQENKTASMDHPGKNFKELPPHLRLTTSEYEAGERRVWDEKSGVWRRTTAEAVKLMRQRGEI